MTDISHLVVIGCSFSYGDGLDNPKDQSWAGLLSKKLNVPVVNLSTRGGGNDRIMRRLYEYHYLNSSNNNNPFYIIAYSHSSRREEYFKSAENYMVVDMKYDPVLSKKEPFSLDCIRNYDPIVAVRKKLMIRSYIADFFSANKLNYLTTDFMPDTEAELDYLRETYPIAYDRIYSDKFRIQDLEKISRNYPKLPCGHDGVDAQLVMAEYIHDEILSKYPSIATTHQDHITLKQYTEHYNIVGSSGDIEWL